MGWIVVADTDRFDDCLVSVGFCDEEDAQKFADELNADQELQNKYGIKGHRNFRPKHTEPRNEWWNDPFLAN